MKIQTALIGILAIFLLIAAASAAGSTSTTSTGSSSSTSSVSASTTVSAEEALSQVYVSSVTVDPQVFYPGDQGTITVQLTNTGSQDVAFEHGDILNSQNVYIPDETHNPYQVMTFLGPGNTMTYTFNVVAKSPDGLYYPDFSVASRDAGSIIYPIKVQVDSTPVHEAISVRPDNFALDNTDTVNLTITNPRNGAINNVEITPSGTGFGVSPLQSFIVSIPGDSSVDVPFAITPYQAGSNVTFIVQYSNGQTIQNPHTDTVVMPLNIGSSKTAASTVINDLALTVSNGAYQLTGDVTNTGITDANGLVVSVGSPAQPIEPYSSYAVGSLTSNDFSSFTLTFTASDLSAIPITTSWKDSNGNTLSSVQTFDLRRLVTAGSTSRSGSGSSSGSSTSGGPGGSYRGGGGFLGMGGGSGLAAFYPIIIGAIVVIAAVVLYVKRKWILGKFRKQ
ncbi:hypothetical protein [Methanoregula sp.]|uniref:hypothetical protein n=1 Tax=Methanoregula sp. TaxID=2052170 RepID=UPI002C18884B|nr:hypothetical protein [Methanoregula sp.]HVP97364.1 hypothetical protein [Methanoregula sp.]